MFKLLNHFLMAHYFILEVIRIQDEIFHEILKEFITPFAQAINK